MDFGLNLILTFTDKATTGLKSAVGALDTVTAQVKSSASMLTKLGNSFSALTSLGVGMTAAVTAPIAGFMGKIVQYGIQRASFVEDTKLAFNTLMGDAAKASTYLNDLMTFAKTTPFTYESITSAAQNMLAVGIDSTKILGDKMNDFKGGILQALGDVAGATGKGAQGFAYYADVMGKMAAEGKVSSIRLQQLAVQGLNLSNVLGKSTEELKKMTASDLIDEFVEKANKDYAGMMSGLKQTWTGAKDTFVSSLKTAGLELMGFYQDAEGISRYTFLENMTTGLNHLSNAVKTISPILQPIMDFINDAMNKGAEFIDNTAQLFTVLKDGERVLTPLGKIASNILKVLVLAGPALIVVGKLGGSIIPIITTVRNILGSFPLLVPALLGMFALVWSAWHGDLFSIQHFVFDFVSGIIDAFSKAREYVNMDVESMMENFNALDSSTFFGNLTRNLMKVMVFLDGITDAWNDGTMSLETYQKAEEIGVIDMISRVLDLKYRVEEFLSGFKKGFRETVESMLKVGKKLAGILPKDLGKKLENFLTLITGDDLDTWESFGEMVGKMAPKIIVGAVAIKMLFNAINMLSSIGTVISGIGTSLGKLGTKLGSLGIGDALSGLGANISSAIGTQFADLSLSGLGTGITDVLSGIFAGVNIPVVGAVAAGVVASILAFAFKKPEEFKVKIDNFVSVITERFEALKESASHFLEPITSAFDNLITAAQNLWDALSKNETIQILIDMLATVGQVIMDVVMPTLSGIVNVIITIVENIINIVSNVLGGIIDIISGIINIISGIISGDTNMIMQGIDQVLQAILNIVSSVLGGILDVLTSVVGVIVGFIMGAVQGIVDLVQGALDGILSFISSWIGNALDAIGGFISSVLRFFGFDGLADKVSGAFNKVKNIITGVIDSIKKIVSNGVEAFKKTLNFDWKLPDLKLPHFSVTGGEPPFGIMGKGSLPKLDIKWYKQGGVFDKPSVIGVGEAGTEAVMPLESNLEWIDLLAKRLIGAINVVGGTTNIQNVQNVASPSNVPPVVPSVVAGNTTTNNTTSNTDSRNIDNRVVFNSGAIQINMSGSSDIDISSVAQKIMSEIARQKQIQDSMNYGINFAVGGV